MDKKKIAKVCKEFDVVPMDFKPEPKIKKGEDVFIFQHPRGGPKQFSNEVIIAVKKPFVYYKADTDEGSSGSPVLRNLEVIALHHKGSKKGGYNKGTLCSEIIKHLNTGECKLILF